MALIILAFLYGAFVVGSPSFITIICMNAVKRYINRYFIYGAMLTLSFVLICYYIYSFLIEKQMDTLINKIGCKMAENEPDFSLGIMDCYTRFNVFLDFFGFPLLIVLIVTSLAWIAMLVMLLYNYNIKLSAKAKKIKEKALPMESYYMQWSFYL